MAWLFLVVPLGRLAHLLGIWRLRVRDAADATPPQRFTREELGRPSRRFGAFAVDSVLGVVASIIVLFPLVALAGSSDLVCDAVVVRRGPDRVRRRDRSRSCCARASAPARRSASSCSGCASSATTTASSARRRATARELLVKAPFWTGSISLLFIPALVNGVWSILDPERRGLQDRAAGTRVVRATPPPQ